MRKDAARPGNLYSCTVRLKDPCRYRDSSEQQESSQLFHQFLESKALSRFHSPLNFLPVLSSGERPAAADKIRVNSSELEEVDLLQVSQNRLVFLLK